MNWTGGRLQRHSTGNRNVAARQRQHFAKVQQNLRSGPKKKSPVKWNILNHVVEDHRQSRRGSSAVESAPSRHSDRGYSSQGRSLQPIPSLPSRQEIGDGPRIDEPQENLPTSVERRASPIPDDDLYNATPPLRRPRIKREAPVDLPEVECSEEFDESLLEKRRRLLRKGDWAGVSMHKPVGIKFVASVVEENVGRRKKLTNGHRARYQSRQIRITSPFAKKRRRLHGPSMDDPHPLQQKTDVRISIGGKVVPPGVSSSSVEGRGASRLRDDRSRSFTASPDMMLLNGEDGNTAHGGKTQKRATVDPHLRNLDRAQTSFGVPRMKVLMQSQQEISGPAQSHRTLTELPPSGTDDPESLGYGSRNSEQESATLNPPNNQNETPTSEEDEEVFIVSSLPPSLHQPVPHSSRVSRFLQSNSSEKCGTTLGQVGKVKPVVPRSQLLENEVLASWIALNTDSDKSQEGYATNCDQDARNGVSISPGISTIFATREVGWLDREEVQSSPLESPDLNEEELAFPDLAFPNDQGEVIADNRMAVTEDIVPARNSTALPKAKLAEDGNREKATYKDLQEETDEIWRKFVFGAGSDEMDVSHTAKQALRTGTQDENLGNLSTMGHTGTDTSPDSRMPDGGDNPNVPVSQWSKSSGYSRIMEEVPVVTSSISLKSKQRLGVKQPPREDDRLTSTHATYGSSTEIGAASPLASMVAHTSTSSFPSSGGPGSVPFGSQRKVLFTIPTPFTGRKSNHLQEEEPLHIVRSLRGRLGEMESNEARREQRHDIHDLYGSEEDVESIEDS